MYEGLRVCARIQSLDAKEEREDAGQKELSRREDVIVAAVNDACGSGDACETEALQRAIERWNTIVTPNLYVALPGGGGSTQCYIATGYLCCGPGLYMLKRCFQMVPVQSLVLIHVRPAAPRACVHREGEKRTASMHRNNTMTQQGHTEPFVCSTTKVTVNQYLNVAGEILLNRCLAFNVQQHEAKRELEHSTY
ncbi:hypothetical protein B0H17DRAFT_1150479 [Mycena rosella]|uniref:Uncharacterized protein n=1 Tax=Mycena rosella TaxID=1033263 RepID=A0AAD7BSN6_MYCRO|nr:hypothetical protein B0H17DRAFT_1150479 [Mycena rosella]